jgi:hypothetical protein
MARLRSPLVAVMKQGKLHGVITASRLLTVTLSCGLIDNRQLLRTAGTRRLSELST